jgi:hypothetical protein
MQKFIVYTLAMLFVVNTSRAADTDDIKAALSNTATVNTPPAPAADMPDGTTTAAGPEGFGTDARDNEIWVTAKTTKTELDKMRHYVSANNDNNTVLFMLNALLLLIAGASFFLVVLYIIKKRRGLSFS